MEYIRNYIQAQKEKSDSEKAAKFTAQIERDIAERTQQRNRRLSEINSEIRSLNGIIKNLNTYISQLEGILNLPKAPGKRKPNTKILMYDDLTEADWTLEKLESVIHEKSLEIVSRQGEIDRLNDEKRYLEAEIAAEINEDDQIRRETEAEIKEIMERPRPRGKGGATNKRRRKMRGGKTKRRRTLKKRRPRKTQRRAKY
jgi:hypothetical protein